MEFSYLLLFYYLLYHFVQHIHLHLIFSSKFYHLLYHINIIINGESAHLDLIYKFETKKLEDHIRITTRISEKNDDISCILYIDYNQGNEFVKELEGVKKAQQENMNK